MRLIAKSLYGLYAIVVFASLALLAMLIMALLPGLSRRRWLARGAARAFLRLAAMPLTVVGLEHLPEGPCILVANHCSYLDGLVFTAALPPRFGFVIKREMAKVPLAGFLLTQIGSQFMARDQAGQTTNDARRVMRSAASGQSMVFFSRRYLQRRARAAEVSHRCLRHGAARGLSDSSGHHPRVAHRAVAARRTAAPRATANRDPRTRDANSAEQRRNPGCAVS